MCGGVPIGDSPEKQQFQQDFCLSYLFTLAEKDVSLAAGKQEVY